jgi:hypothetical protein
MNYDDPYELRQAAFEMARKASETANTYKWAQPAADSRRFTSIPLGAGAVDWEEAALTRKRAAARRELGNALQQSGLTEKWRKAEQADAEVAQWFASDVYKTGAIGKLLKIGDQR